MSAAVGNYRGALNAALRHDFGTFVVKAYQTVFPGTLYLHNWHIDAIVFQLMRLDKGEHHRLIITLPPRSLKSLIISAAYPGWCIGRDPTRRFACVSYGSELASTLSRQFRQIVSSAWYRQLFPAVRFSKDTESEISTTRGGGRIAVTVGGSLTGRGADFIIIDDPIKAEEAQSDVTRRAVNEWFSRTLAS